MKTFDNSFLTGRIATDLTISEEYTYVDGLMYTLKTMMPELERYLSEEGRYFGVMIPYINTINGSFKTLFTPELLKEEEIYQRITFLYKPILIKEFKKLGGKRVSKADRLITIFHKVLNVILETEDYPGNKEVKNINKIITKLFNNIRNTSKNSSLYSLVNFIRKYKELGYIGKYPMKTLIMDDEVKSKEQTVLLDSGVRIDQEFNNKISEVSWTEN